MKKTSHKIFKAAENSEKERHDHVCTEKKDMITKAFKKCGMFNDVNGKENHLVKLKRMPDYEPPVKSDPPLPVKKNSKRKRTNKLGSLLHGKRQKIEN